MQNGFVRHSPPAPLAAGDGVLDVCLIQRNAGESLGIGLHLNLVAELVASLNPVCPHFKRRPLVFLHADGCGVISEILVLNLYSVSAHKAGCRNLERGFKRAVDICLDFFLVNSLAIMVFQDDRVGLAFNYAGIFSFTPVGDAFYVHCLARAVDRPVCEQMELVAFLIF